MLAWFPVADVIEASLSDGRAIEMEGGGDRCFGFYLPQGAGGSRAHLLIICPMERIPVRSPDRPSRHPPADRMPDPDGRGALDAEAVR